MMRNQDRRKKERKKDRWIDSPRIAAVRYCTFTPCAALHVQCGLACNQVHEIVGGGTLAKIC
uniref:Uncharacterized protein n=1 Tax=Oryza meridionalis TaxID=40149 RepID=A0A0E0CLU3_9ORYZ